MKWATTPGARDSDSCLSELTWFIERTVAATYKQEQE